jgi:hypothetical protein
LKSFENNKAAQRIIEQSTKPIENDLDLFLAVTGEYEKLIRPVKGNIITDFNDFRKPECIEIAHIDSAKSLALWNSILPVISDGAIPGVTTFVFQDFERCRLPWQWLFVSEVLEKGLGHWISAFDGGTVHLRITEKISATLVEASSSFKYDETRALELWEGMRSFIAQDDNAQAKFRGDFEDISKCTLAYIHYYQGRNGVAKEIASEVSEAFLAREPIYRSELID